MSPLAAALLAELTDADLAALAEKLRPYIHQSDSDLLMPSAAAARLGVHVKTLTRAAKVGRVPGAARVGKAWRFRADQLELLPAARIAPAAAQTAPMRSTTSAAAAIRGKLAA